MANTVALRVPTLARLLLREIAAPRGQREAEVVAELIRRAAVAELGAAPGAKDAGSPGVVLEASACPSTPPTCRRTGRRAWSNCWRGSRASTSRDKKVRPPVTSRRP